MKTTVTHAALCTLLTALVLNGSVYAYQNAIQEETQRDDVEHVSIGTRNLSAVARQELSEKRAVEVFQTVEEEMQERVGTPVVAMQERATEADDELIAKAIKSYYYTSHPGALHFPTAVTAYGDVVKLEDGSEYFVAMGDRYKTLNWLLTDTIIITQNTDFFSIYDFRLININTGVSVAVNLALGPYYNGPYTRYIVGIDYFWDKVYLNDGSCWDFFWDNSIMQKWILNDTVIIGINDGSFSSSEPNILINVSTLEYARCKCVN